VTVSTRSRILLGGASLFPFTVAFFRLASLEQRRALAAHVSVVLGDFTGLVPDIFIDGGILCFVGFVVSIAVDYFRSR
jgi:hypothetical protein